MADLAQRFGFPDDTGPSRWRDIRAQRDLQDLVLLGSLALNAPLLILGRCRPDGSWDVTCSDGASSRPEVHRLLDLVHRSEELVEFSALAGLPGGRWLSDAPRSFRWACGVALRADGPGSPVHGAVIVLDRAMRQVTVLDHRVLRVLVRRVQSRLGLPHEAVPVPAAPVSPVPPSHGNGDVSTFRPVAGSVVPLMGALLGGERLLRSRDVAGLFDVTERTVLNWAASGVLPSFRTFGGHLRFRDGDIAPLLGRMAPEEGA